MQEELYNTEYAMNEFSIRGEVQIMNNLSYSGINLERIFDVGANIGEWKRMVRDRHPNSEIHMFEPMPSTYRKQLDNGIIDNLTITNPFGLGKEPGFVDVVFDPTNDRLTSAVTELPRNHPTTRPIMMLNGDTYCKIHQIDHIDYLKIDTEGWEMNVLRGFDEMLRSRKIEAVQFEFGYANILTKDLLLDYYRLFEPLNYVIGRVTPNGVKFKRYDWVDEDWQGPDFLAVKREREDIISATLAHQSN